MTRTRIALIAVAVTLAAAGLGGTAGNSASDRVAAPSAARPAGLVPFRSCGDLLGYVKSQAVPLVGPWGFGGSVHAPGPLAPGVAAPAAGSAKTDAGTGPTEGVDYSGTNVQEQGVDEPDSVKTNGKTLFAVAGNRAERGRRHRLAPEAARLAEARQRLEPRAPARRRPPARALARRLLADAAARPDRARAAVLPRHTRPSRRSTSPTRRRCGSSTRSRSTAATSTRASSARPRASSSPRRCRRSCRS